MYNQFNLCKQCDDGPVVFNGLCSTCLDASLDEEKERSNGGNHLEKFPQRKTKNRKRNSKDSFDDGVA